MQANLSEGHCHGLGGEKGQRFQESLMCLSMQLHTQAVRQLHTNTVILSPLPFPSEKVFLVITNMEFFFYCHLYFYKEQLPVRLTGT